MGTSVPVCVLVVSLISWVCCGHVLLQMLELSVGVEICAQTEHPCPSVLFQSSTISVLKALGFVPCICVCVCVCVSISCPQPQCLQL